jgi:hypothetical protein
MKKTILALMSVTIGLLCLFSFYNPKSTPLIIHMAIFVFLYVWFVMALLVIIKTGFYKLKLRRQLFVATILAFFPVAIIALFSVGGLTLLNFIISLGIPTIIVWYGLRSKAIE